MLLLLVELKLFITHVLNTLINSEKSVVYHINHPLYLYIVESIMNTKLSAHKLKYIKMF